MLKRTNYLVRVNNST